MSTLFSGMRRIERRESRGLGHDAHRDDDAAAAATADDDDVGEQASAGESMSARMTTADRYHNRRRPARRRYNPYHPGAPRRRPADSRLPTKTAHPRASSPEDPP